MWSCLFDRKFSIPEGGRAHLRPGGFNEVVVSLRNTSGLLVLLVNSVAHVTWNSK